MPVAVGFRGEAAFVRHFRGGKGVVHILSSHEGLDNLTSQLLRTPHKIVHKSGARCQHLTSAVSTLQVVVVSFGAEVGDEGVCPLFI